MERNSTRIPGCLEKPNIEEPKPESKIQKTLSSIQGEGLASLNASSYPRMPDRAYDTVPL